MPTDKDVTQLLANANGITVPRMCGSTREIGLGTKNQSANWVYVWKNAGIQA